MSAFIAKLNLREDVVVRNSNVFSKPNDVEHSNPITTYSEIDMEPRFSVPKENGGIICLDCLFHYRSRFPILPFFFFFNVCISCLYGIIILLILVLLHLVEFCLHLLELLFLINVIMICSNVLCQYDVMFLESFFFS